MKKIIAIIATFVLFVGMAGCGNENTNSQTKINTTADSEHSNINESDYSFTNSDSQIDTTNRNESVDNIKTSSINNTSKVGSTTPAHTHYYASKVTKEATCGATGVKTFMCSCGSSYTETIPATGWHEWESATCTQPQKCKICGKTDGEALGHSYYSYGECSRCGQMNPAINETLSKCSLELPSLPQTISYYGYGNKLYSSVQITAISYEFEYRDDGKVTLTAKFSGTKTYDYKGTGQSDSCKIGWKLYDPNGNVFDTGTLYSPSVAVGESFTNEEETLIYKRADPGKYKLVILDVN